MKNILFISFVIVTIAGCSGVKTGNSFPDLEGTYRGQNSEESIEFKRSGLYFLTPPSYETFNDTLDYGVWRQEKELITLNSDKKILKDYFNLEVEESFSGSKDSIYINIVNQEYGLTDYKEVFYPYIYYTTYLKNSLGSYFESKLFYKKLAVAKTGIPIEFGITIIPNLITYPAKISKNTLGAFYNIKNSDNNTFKVTINGFDYKDFSYRRFQGEYIRIINNDTLVWDNELFLKK